MSKISFVKATKAQSRLRMALIGPPGSGKTYSALEIATELGRLIRQADRGEGRIAVIDSERGSASKYAGIFEFEKHDLETFSPNEYVDAITAAELAGFDVVIVDSLSHAWMGKDGALEQVDKFAARDKGNSFGAWRHVTPMHNKLVDTMLSCRAHLIVTMRVKTEWVLEKNKDGKNVPRKVGMAPIQRDGLEYEFDVVGDIDNENVYCVTKTRVPTLNQAVIDKPGAQIATTLFNWLSDGAPVIDAPRPTAGPSPAEQRIANPRIKELFDKLGAPEAKRVATAEKYRDDAKLIEVLEKRVADQLAEQNKTAAPTQAPEAPAS